MPAFWVKLAPPSSGKKSDARRSVFLQKHWYISAVYGITSEKAVIFRIEMGAYISSDFIFCMLF